MTYETTFLSALAGTILIEVVVVVVVCGLFLKKSKHTTRHIVTASIFGSLLTLPYFWFVLPAYIHTRTLYVWTGESTIILIEALILWYATSLRGKHALIVSFLANMASIALTPVLYLLW
jgi:hypothetical protein